MKLIYLIMAILFAGSCINNSAISKQLSGSDSLVINFNKPQSDSIDKTMTTTERKAIKKLAGFVDNKTTEAFKCGYDGNLLFYKQGKLAGDVSINFSGDGCRHFIQLVNDKLTSTAMSNEAAAFLKSLADGKEWY
jgi:hypothetical protein